MTENEKLELERFTPYIRREAAIKWGAWGLVGGLGAALLLNTAAWLFPILTHTPRVALSLGIPALITLLVFLTAYLYPRSTAAIARLSDKRMQLKARLSTALEIQAGKLPVSNDIAARQWNDARAAACGADPQLAFAFQFPRRQSLIAALLLALLVTSLVLTNPQDAVIAQSKADQAAIQQQIERLQTLRDEIAANDDLSPEVKETLLKEIDDTIRDLQEGDLSKEEAVARLSETEEKLKTLLDENVDAQQAALQEAGQQIAEGEQTQQLGQALQEGNLEGAAQELENLGAQLPNMSAQELETLAQQLEAMANAVQETNPELAEALREAAAAMRQGDIAAAQEALARAAELTREAGEQIAAQEATEQALGQVQEGRRQIAQSGQCEGCEGEQGEGQGQEGQGQGQEGQQGQGQGQSGSGHGESTGQGTPCAPGGELGENAPGKEGQTPYDPVYDPERLGEGEGETVRIQVEGGEGGPPTGETEGGPRDDGQALVPYDQVYADYQAQAASALDNSYIPRGMKDYVRAYFGALEPD